MKHLKCRAGPLPGHDDMPTPLRTPVDKQTPIKTLPSLILRTLTTYLLKQITTIIVVIMIDITDAPRPMKIHFRWSATKTKIYVRFINSSGNAFRSCASTEDNFSECFKKKSQQVEKK